MIIHLMINVSGLEAATSRTPVHGLSHSLKERESVLTVINMAKTNKSE